MKKRNFARGNVRAAKPWARTEETEARIEEVRGAGSVGYVENEREIAMMNRRYNKMRFSDELTY